MYILNVVTENPIIFSVLGFIVVFNLSCILYLIHRERKDNIEESEDVIANLITPEPEKEVIDKLELEDVLEEMQKNLQASPEEVVSNFEQEQEEKSIISYQELINALKSEQPVFTEIKEDLQNEMNQPVTEELKSQLKETLQTIELNKQEALESLQTEQVEKKPEKKKIFKATEFISPIFGIISNKKQENSRYDRHKIAVEFSNQELEDKKANPKLEETFSSDDYNEEFLNALKEFRRKLE